jgi:hypothetical protein
MLPMLIFIVLATWCAAALMSLSVNLALLMIFCTTTVIGQQGIDRTHNYENGWGALFWWSVLLTLITTVVTIGQIGWQYFG